MKKLLLIISIIIPFTLTGCFLEKEITLDEAGTYDYEEKTANKDVHISADGVVLQNLTIDADLYIDESVADGHVELHNVDVTGTVYVYGGGLETILIQDGKIYKLIGYVESRIEATEDTVIDEVVVTSPGIILENSETAEDSYPNVVVDIESPNEEDNPVILDGVFDSVEISAGNNIEVAEQTRIRYMGLSVCSNESCPAYNRTRVKVRETAQIGEMDMDQECTLNNEGTIDKINYGENIMHNGNKITSKDETDYIPQITNNVTMSINSNTGDYTINFETNNTGKIHYVVQPWFDSTGASVSAKDIASKKGYDFSIGGNNTSEMSVASAKSITVSEAGKTVKGTGYMGDRWGQRPPQGDNIKFSTVLWYVFEDDNGNYSEVGKLTIK